MVRPKIQIFRFIKIFGIIINTWPNDPNEGKLTFILREIDWNFAFLTTFAIEIYLMCAIYKCWNDVTTTMKALAQLFSGMEVLLNFIIFKLKSTHVQILLKEIEDFLRTANDNEGIILQKYMDRYFCFFAFVVICNCSAVIVFSSGPVFLSTKFPIEGWCLLPTELPVAIYIFFYAIQVYIIIKAGFNFAVNFIVAIFFVYSSAKLEILCLKIQNAKSKRQINSCIKKHQKIIKFVNKTKYTVRYIIYKTYIVMALTIIFGIFPIIGKQPLWVSSQFIFIVICGYQRLYVTAWTADDLKENSKQIAMEIYNMPWFEKTHYNTKNVCFMIQRSQMPLEIYIRGLLPTLSREYFAKYLITMFSYFTTMRAIIDD